MSELVNIEVIDPTPVPVVEIHVDVNAAQAAIDAANQAQLILEMIQTLIEGASLNGITTLGTITIVADEVTFEDFAWKIDGVDYAQVSPITRTLPFAAEGMYRTHTAYFTTTNDIDIAVGAEDDEVTTEPDIPEGTLRMRAFNVFGEVITVGPGVSAPFDLLAFDEFTGDTDGWMWIKVLGYDFKIKRSTLMAGSTPFVQEANGAIHRTDLSDTLGGESSTNLTVTAGRAKGEQSHADSGGNAEVLLSHGDSGGNALGTQSHADSSGETYGEGSHANSSGQAVGNNSHANSGANASGNSSHANSGGKANNSYSFASAEGEANGVTSSASGPGSIANSYSETAIGCYGEEVTAIDASTFNGEDLIYSIGIGTDSLNRKTSFSAYKNGAFKFISRLLSNITNAGFGFFAFDENARPNTHDGTKWNTLAYLQDIYDAIEGLKTKQPVRVATTDSIFLNDVQLIDGVVLVENDRILVKDQSDAELNGIYIVKEAADWVRSTDANTATELTNAVVSVLEGTANSGSTYRQVTTSIVLETSNIVWQSFGTSVPDATDSTKGKAKLAAAFGSNTDTAVRQDFFTSEVAKKKTVLINDVVPSSPVTGTILEAVLKAYEIPSGITPQDFIADLRMDCMKSGSAGIATLRYRINTTPVIAGSTIIGYVNSSTGNTKIPLKRQLTSKGGNIEVLYNNASSVDDNLVSSNPITTYPFSNTNTYWLMPTVQLASGGDSVYLNNLKLEY